jgi:hypothetical protein
MSNENKSDTPELVSGILADVIDIIGLGRSAYDKVADLFNTPSTVVTEADSRAKEIQDQRSSKK